MPAFPTDLTTTEKDVIAAVSAGNGWVNPGDMPTPAQLADADFVAKMPQIRAEVIRALCLGARLNNATPDPIGVQIGGARIVSALNLSFATVDVPLVLSACHFANTLNFSQAKLAFLNLSGCRLERGLDADGVKIAGSLFCRNGFCADGEIRLLGAEIGGDVDYNGASLRNRDIGTLKADGVKIAGGLFLTKGFVSEGEIRLPGAEIGGSVDLDGASLRNSGRDTINTNRIKIAGSLFCRNGFSIDGSTILTAASIGKWFHWKPSQWTGLLRLSHAHAGQWADNWRGDGWKNDAVPVVGKPKIDIDAFSYDALADDGTDKDAASRIAWVRKSQEGRMFVPGPYETLAKALRAAGDEDGANEVAYAKRVDQANARKDKLGHRISDFILGAFVGYGYKPWRGFYWLIGLLMISFCIFSVAAPMGEGGTGVVKPAAAIVFDNKLTRCAPDFWHPGQACATFIDKIEPLETHAIYYFLPIEYTPFSPFWYALDTLIPLVDLGQETAWSPSPIDQSVLKDPWGWAALIYLYVHIIMGWLLTTLTVVALTGVIKKE